ncbi:PA14 domain-containing protein [Chitinophaga sp. YR573]|uniref:DUF5977 domain-containing protein n=1 Tax=Chitinophaga sp. YR573 TaxID=1881040 RepID=UPI0008B92C1C|nr:DUF5977 domain-containing protein [Chitinophaga sp. YR573]SEW40102.1 PA14 domain-containing protein [Chitinophaga sp. YR573]
MILELAAKGKKTIASLMLALLYFETIIPSYALGVGRSSFPRVPIISSSVPAKKIVDPVFGGGVKSVLDNSIKGKLKQPVSSHADDLGGPTQPESQAFHSVNSDNMVDLFSGDFNYSIPLIDVGGYPIALGYSSGITMDQEASWVGLGWNINPGTITRNLRGLPDDFNGTDTIQKISAIKPNKTIGVTVGATAELLGYPLLKGGLSVGVLHNSYKGWGLESGINASINVGASSMGKFTSQLSLTNSSQDGVTVGASLDCVTNEEDDKDGKGLGGSMGVGSTFNSRSGMKALQIEAGIKQYDNTDNNTKARPLDNSATFRSKISFASPTYTPGITLPFTNTLYSFNLKIGQETKVYHKSVSLSGYVAKQEIKAEDQRSSLPAYGYLNFQGAKTNTAILLDYNREKEIPYREKPAVPNIALPSYTYDVFAMSGEGTGGMFRAYRGDIGYVHDHYIKTKDRTLGGGLDLAVGDMVHPGVDIGFTSAYTESGPWLSLNPLAKNIAFKSSSGTFEASYFRNPGEMTINSKSFYDNIGGDDIVSVALNQAGSSDPNISTSNLLNRYNSNKELIGQQTLSARNTTKDKRDKRTQVISYLNAAEASTAGLTQYIENYKENTYSLNNCGSTFPTELDADKHGFYGEYFSGTRFQKFLYSRVDTFIDFPNKGAINVGKPTGAPTLNTGFSVRWTGRLKADVTGSYKIITISDDGVRLFLNDSLFIDQFNDHKPRADTAFVNLVAGEVYNVKIEYYQSGGDVLMALKWMYPSQSVVSIPGRNLYLMPSKDTFVVGDSTVSREKRVNDFRKQNHISEIEVLNKDGRRYVYGIPVYNFEQKETSFSVDAKDGNTVAGLVKYTPGEDNTVNNTKGNDHYFSSELMPAYAHSFLLTGILSPDYQDLTGDGISNDDPGNAIKFNYTKIAGIKNPYAWRVPAADSANYNEGLKTDNRDDKGSYVSGDKELWYLNSIESKSMIATFKMSERKDMAAINEDGVRLAGHPTRKLDEINLYNKADFKKYNTKARPVKTVHFEYSYELCMGVNGVLSDSGKLTLKKVWFTYNGNNKGKLNPYVFNYNAKNPTYNAKSYDRWGNYKPSSQNPSGVSNADFPYAVQDSTQAARNAAAWTLDSIILPSGGRIKVDYESDDYAYVQNKRATQMFTVAGFSAKEPTDLGDIGNNLYGLVDNQYIAINVPKAVSSKEEVYARYLQGLEKVYFRLFVNMPSDKFGSGGEYVPCYATLDPNKYGYFNNGNTIWIRVKAISPSGELDMATSVYSPLAKAAIQYLRLNLPSKAYPGSDVGDDIGLEDAVKILFSQADNLMNSVMSFDRNARIKQWARTVDVGRTLVRLNSPYYKKMGGGIRVKRVKIYDHWDAMAKQRESVYGQEYQYTTTRSVNGVDETISSGVASYEPMLGGEENPWRLPIEYLEQIAPLAPMNLGYTEAPLGESLFPGASVGYSKVRVRTIHAKNVRSANGFTETCFYTSYDFPTLVDMTSLADGKKRFRPDLQNFLKINVRHFIGLSQGFKVELNDMNGKMKSQATYGEADSLGYITYTENYYRVDNQQSEFKHLNSTVMTIDPSGAIDSSATIGKDVELMMDMREQHSVTNAYNLNINPALFSFSLPPFWLIPTILSLHHREETLYHSVAATKVITRHGILDSVLSVDKGSQVTARNLLYDAETGDVVLSSTRNEFNDPQYHFSWPSGWTYDGMSGAYKNIGVVLNGVNINQGRITNGINANDYFAAGDEILIGSKQKTGGDDCTPDIATFRAPAVLYAIDANVLTGGTPDIYFTDRDGAPFTGNDIAMKIIRSGRRNIAAGVGEVTLLANPLVKSGNDYALIFDTTKVISASATEFKQIWKVADKFKSATMLNCVAAPYSEYAGTNVADCGVSAGPASYGNEFRMATFKRSNCAANFVTHQGTVYKVPANKYISTVSQAAADSMAAKEIADSGQAFANLHGACYQLFYSAQMTKVFTKNDCSQSGTYGTTVSFTLDPGYITTAVSQIYADSMARRVLNSRGQLNANNNGQCLYYGKADSATYARNNCGAGGAGSAVKYVVANGKNTSPISQAQADSLSHADVLNNGQAYANANGSCTYSNADTSATISRNNCGSTGTTVAVVYSVPAGTFTSPVSLLAANALAKQRIIDSAQTYANRVGVCTYKNVDTSATISRNNCGTGTTVAVIYSVPAGTFTSTASQLAANALAKQRIVDSAQTYANRVGVCTYSNIDTSASISRNNCGTGTTVAVTYSVLAGTFTSTVSQLAANALAKQRIIDSAQTYANRVGVCTYKNIDTSATISRNNCGTGTTVAVTYSVPVGTFTSTVSQLAANALAKQRIIDSAQTYANRVGVCTYSNIDTSASISRNNCGTGTTVAVTYSVPAGTFTSTVSQLAANALAKQRIVDSAQTYANRVGVCTYKNIDTSATVSRNNCGTGTTVAVTYSVPAGTFTSTVSQLAANALAKQRIVDSAQTYANRVGVCTYKNVDTSATISRNNCGTGTTVAVTYSVPAGTFTSTVSQLAANALAKQRIVDSAQTYANRVGVCTYKNIDTSATISRNNCGTGTTVAVTYSVPAGTFTSTVSQLAANALAKQRIVDSAQTYANRVGVCTYSNIDTSATVSRNNCGSTGTTTTVAVIYSVPAGTFTSTVSQLAANALAKQRIIDSAQTYANRVGVCTYYNDSTGKKFLPVCATGYTAADSVWYPVAAKKFSSTISKADANAQAQTDITTNGQAYANTNGICNRTSVTFIVKLKAGATVNTAYGYVTLKTSAGVTIGSKNFDGSDILGGGTTVYSSTATSFTVTMNAMDSCYASVNGSGSYDIYSAARTVNASGTTITVEIWHP